LVAAPTEVEDEFVEVAGFDVEVDDSEVAEFVLVLVSAHATHGVVATAMPTPRATANPPTRPIYLALLMVVPLRRPFNGRYPLLVTRDRRCYVC
jgi:hypothetical protein